MVTDYLERAGLDRVPRQARFNLVGYGCTTCIGNSGPLPEEISAAVNDNDLVVCAVLSGNRNFEGRINQDVRNNYLASPPLCVAYALAGRMDIDLLNEPLGEDADGKPVYLRDLWPSSEEIKADGGRRGPLGHVRGSYADVFTGDERWRALDIARGRPLHVARLDLRPQAAVLRGHGPRAGGPVEPITGARVLAVLGDSVTTDHISPAGAIKKDSPAGRWLIDHGVERARLQLLRLAPRQPRGDDPRHVRQRAAAQPAGRARGRLHPPLPRRRGDDDLRGGDGSTPTRACRWWCSPARSTARARRATGRPRARRCSACGR